MVEGKSREFARATHPARFVLVTKFPAIPFQVGSGGFPQEPSIRTHIWFQFLGFWLSTTATVVNALGARHQLEVRFEAGDEQHCQTRAGAACGYTVESGKLMLEIFDDGAGFDTSQNYPGHLGMHTMRERAEKVSGQFAIESAPDAGTRIRVTIPMTR